MRSECSTSNGEVSLQCGQMISISAICTAFHCAIGSYLLLMLLVALAVGA